MSAPILSSLTIYPVKSMRGIELESSSLDQFGLEFDRRWMLINNNNEFMSARKDPLISTVQPSIDNDGKLHLTLPNGDNLNIPSATKNMPTVAVEIWGDIVNAVHIDPSIDAWISDYLNTSCKLVWFGNNSQRQVDPDFAEDGVQTGFSDGFPLLLISTASLDDLNDRLDSPVEMNRFRPNLVVSNTEPFVEDDWLEFQIGDIKLNGVKPCSRCILTTVDPALGKRINAEPLKTLSTYRTQNNKVMFGQNTIHQSTGTLSVGDTVTVLKKSS